MFLYREAVERKKGKKMRKKSLLLLFIVIFSYFPAHATDQDGAALARNLYKLILKGETDQILSAYSEEPNIDTPRTGEIRGKEAFVDFLGDEKAWLKGYGADPNSFQEVKTTRSDLRVVYEQTITFNKVVPVVPHPFAVVVDLNNGKAKAVRVYYRLSGLTKKYDFCRPAMLAHDPSLLDGIAPPVKQYVASLENAYPDIYQMFSEDGCIQAVCGKRTLAKIYTILLVPAGSIPLRLTTATCDERTCALEENLGSWGDVTFSKNTSGLAVYDYNDEGQLTAARIYDDLGEAPQFQTGWFAKNWPAITERLEAVGCPVKMATPAAEATFHEVLYQVLRQPCAGE